MTTHVFTAANDGSSDPAFRTWVSSLINGWAAGGLTQVTVPGQIDPATVVRPVGARAFAGFALFQLDSDATAPVFIRIDFMGGSTTGQVGLRITVSRSYGPDGTPVGVLLPTTPMGVNTGTGAATVRTHLVSSGPGFFAYLASTDDDSGSAGYGRLSFIVERSRAADGTPTHDGVMVATGSVTENSTPGTGAMTSANQLPMVAAINYASGGSCVGVPPVMIPYSINGTVIGPTTSLAAGSIGPVFPWVLVAPGLAPWQSCVCVSIPAGDLPSGIFSTVLCKRAGTFRSIPPVPAHRWGTGIQPGGNTSSSSGATSHVALGIRWED